MPTHLQVPGRDWLQVTPPRADWSRRGNYTNRKKPGTDSALARTASPAEVCSWHNLCCCPRTLLPFSFVAGRNRKECLLTRLASPGPGKRSKDQGQLPVSKRKRTNLRELAACFSTAPGCHDRRSPEWDLIHSSRPTWGSNSVTGH